MSFRISKARQLLSDGTSRISDVAEKCGFRDIYYFSRVFKKYTGTTPGVYSRKYGLSGKKCRLPEICPYRGNRYYPALIHYTHFPFSALALKQFPDFFIGDAVPLAILFRSLPCLCSSLISAAFHLVPDRGVHKLFQCICSFTFVSIMT